MSDHRQVNHLTAQLSNQLSNQLDGWFANLQDKYTPHVRAQREAYEAQMRAQRAYMAQQAVAKQNKESYEVTQERNRAKHKKRLSTKPRSGQTEASRPRSSGLHN